LPELIDTDTGRIHTNFNQAATATGRLSSSDPNLQNIPIRTEVGREIRKAFVADRGKLMVTADYSQIELRILAHISGDENLISAFRNGTDIHTKTASEVFHVPLDMVTKEMRKSAKAVNFGIVYGISDYSLSLDIGETHRRARRLVRPDRHEHAGGTADRFRGVAARDVHQEPPVEMLWGGGRSGFIVTTLGRSPQIICRPGYSSPR
jgi:DNA polymerase-1